MSKFSGILICTDLDGTLYRNDKSISPENKEAIEYFKREGGYFTFITGRMPYYLLDAYNAVQPNVPFGCNNGGGLYDGVAKKYIRIKELSRSVTELIQIVDKCFPEVGIQLCGFDKTYFAKENEATVYFRRVTGVPKLTCNYREITEPLAKIIFCTDNDEEIFGIEKTLKEHPLAEKFEFIRSERRLFEILPKGVHKGLSLEMLVDYLKSDAKKTVAIGDYNNDIGMLKAAGIGIAVSNASKEALAAADAVTVSNEEHAIARVIHDLESGKLQFN